MSPLPIFDYDHHEHYNQFSQEVRLTSSGDERFNYIVGAYFQSDDLNPMALNKLNLAAQPAPFGSPLPPISRLSFLDQQTKNYSLFFDANYQLTDALKVNAAARYMRIEKSATQGSYSVFINTTTPNPAIEQAPAPGLPSIYARVYGTPHIFRGLELSEEHFMPEVGLQYDIGEGMIYGKVVRGAKAGGFDWVYAGADRNALKFLPEKATSYELGYRGTLLDGSLFFGFTLYRMDIEDLQVSVFDGRTSYVVGNAAEQRAQGFETDFTWRPTRALRINGALAYSDAYWVSYPNSACYLEQRLATPAGQVCRQDLTGKPAPVNSKWTWAIGFTHKADVGQFLLTTQANYSYRTESNLGLSGDPMQIQKPFGLLDARVALSTADERWTFAVFGKNLTDELYSDYGTDAPSTTGVRFRDTQRTRQVGVEISTKF
jgi:outer membrane receptor protein involved in Fe transport